MEGAVPPAPVAQTARLRTPRDTALYGLRKRCFELLLFVRKRIREVSFGLRKRRLRAPAFRQEANPRASLLLWPGSPTPVTFRTCEALRIASQKKSRSSSEFASAVQTPPGDIPIIGTYRCAHFQSLETAVMKTCSNDLVGRWKRRSKESEVVRTISECCFITLAQDNVVQDQRRKL